MIGQPPATPRPLSIIETMGQSIAAITALLHAFSCDAMTCAQHLRSDCCDMCTLEYDGSLEIPESDDETEVQIDGCCLYHSS
jgi:hypothetical protein